MKLNVEEADSKLFEEFPALISAGRIEAITPPVVPLSNPAFPALISAGPIEAPLRP
ncbi:hypothetical protein SBA4_330045 [Candidatus Sulfopaludibacter sp. SbA4]|nr:hypothetical protein SBA4_330045 [Candidatus Sulfopaludibacter sp. SbA4]